VGDTTRVDARPLPLRPLPSARIDSVARALRDAWTEVVGPRSRG